MSYYLLSMHVYITLFFYQYNKNYKKISLYMYGQLNITETVEFIDDIKLVMFSSYFSKLSTSIIYSLLLHFGNVWPLELYPTWTIYFRQ